MKTICTISFILLCSTVKSQSLTVNQTVDYINKYLPQLLSGTGTLGAKIYNPKIECDMFGNITYKATLDYPDEPGKYKKEINRVFSVKDANYIWVYATTYSDGSFAGYQIRIEKNKLSVPIFTFEITDKDDGEKICKAFLHLKSITKADPFKWIYTKIINQYITATQPLEVNFEDSANHWHLDFWQKEMMNTLYIIGNGFDRYHGLDTRYQSFALFLKSKYNNIYEMFTQYYGLPDLDENDKASLYDPLWADFENALAKLDFQSVLEDNTDYLANPSSPDFRDRDWNTYQIEMEMIVNKLTKDLYKAFKEFILAVEFPENIDNKILDFKNDSAFLNFNYTDTLEQYYFIKASRILYIHGKAKNPGSILVLGHGREPSSFKEEVVKEPNGLSEEELQMWRENMADEYDYSYELGKGELMSYFNGSFKSTQEIIKKNQAYFNDLKNVKEVFVLGHSVSEVDQPYFKSVIQGISDKKATWTITYYSNSDQVSHLAKLTAVGLDKSQINLVKMETLKRNFPTLF